MIIWGIFLTEITRYTELIYQFIYSKIGLKHNLPSYLKFRRKKPNLTNFVSVHDIAQEINKCKETGHWEGDFIIFTTLRSKNITALVERKIFSFS